jgi:arabinofuranosyltransferase
MSAAAPSTDSGRTALSTRGRVLYAVGLWALACVGCYFGWKVFWFLVDDAYIAFRYISNRWLGYGYTWNAPPFLPVEGYSSLLWIVLLDAIWSLFGIEPPASANVVSLICAFGSLAIVALWVTQRWTDITAGLRLPWLLFWTLALVVVNRNFLIWSSSGMETALFNLLLLLWLFLAFGLLEAPRRNAALIAATAWLLTMTRPDGLLFWLATCMLLAVLGNARALAWPALGVRALPLLGTPLHVGWRYWYYGSWLPNTYYAKVVSAWPEAGVRYLASFVLEYGLLLWLSVLALVCARVVRARAGSWRRLRSPAALLTAIACGAVLAHLGYYVIVVGGDHFEYRVLSQLAPLIALAFVRAAALLASMPLAGVLCAALLVFGNVIPWTHWELTRHVNERAHAVKLTAKVAPALAQPFALLALPFDALQAELIGQGIGVRHQEHKVFRLWQSSLYPSRANGLKLRARQPNPVHVYPCVGVPAWSLPRFHIVDSVGLNDYVIARTPVPRHRRGYMAHERTPPPGYIESFLPNIQFNRARRLIELRRVRPLTDARIREIERRYRAIVDQLR